MKKLLFVVFAFLSVSAYAQSTNTPEQPNNRALSFGIENILARKSPFFGYGFGGSIKGEYPVGESLSLTGTAGYDKFFVKGAYKNPSGSTPLASFIPIKVGAKYFIGSFVYAEGELGGTIETNYEKKKYVNLTVGIGYLISITPRTGLDLSIRYEDWGDQAIKMGALRAAFRADWL